MSRAAYERGLVIIQCDGCTNRHLIADHLGWMDHRLGRGVDIERILKERGETVHRVDIGKALGDSVAADHVNGDELVPVTRAASAHEARSDACIELLPEDLAAFDDKQGGTGNTSSSKS